MAYSYYYFIGRSNKKNKNNNISYIYNLCNNYNKY